MKAIRQTILILSLVLVCGCASMLPTTVRQHPSFAKNVIRPTSLAVLPPEVVVEHLVFDGNHHRLPEKEKAITKTIIAELPNILTEKEYLVERSLSDHSKVANFAFEFHQLIEAYSNRSEELYQRFELVPSKAFSMEKSIGPMVNRISEHADADALLIVRYNGFEKSAGLQTKEFAGSLLFAALTGVLPMHASQGATVEAAIIDGISGDILWTNIFGGSFEPEQMIGLVLRDLPPPASESSLPISTYTTISRLKKNMETVGNLKVTCNNPYPLARDCSSLSGASRKIKIDAIPFKIAGSADGKVVLLRGINLFVPGKYQASLEGGLDAVITVLERHNIGVNKIVGITSWKDTLGYFLELDRDGYSILENYSFDSSDADDTGDPPKEGPKTRKWRVTAH